MPSIDAFAALVGEDHGLCVVSTLRPDRTIASSVVNAGVLDHPLNGQPVAAFVARGDARKLAYLRAGAPATLVLRAGWRWAAVEGPVELAGPDDPLEGLPPEQVPQLLRDVFAAAGGTHDDWATYDRVMAQERRAAVLVTPRRVYTNRAG